MQEDDFYWLVCVGSTNIKQVLPNFVFDLRFMLHSGRMLRAIRSIICKFSP